MKRLALIIILMSTGTAAAQEAWCTANPASCVCSDTFQSTTYHNTYIDSVGATYAGDQVGSKPCRSKDSIGDRAWSINWSYVNGTAFADNLLIRDRNSDGDSENALDKLPAGNSVVRFLRAVDKHTGSFRFGYAGLPLAALGSERIAMRWYSYHASNYEWAGDGTCTNGKIAHNDSSFLASPMITLTAHGGGSGGATTLYSFGDGASKWVWPGHSSFGGFNSGAGPHPGSGVSTYSYRGKWYRNEIVAEHPRASSSGGYDFHYYVKNITDNTPEVEDVRFSSNCNGCGVFPDNSNNWRWDSTIHPSVDLPDLRTELYRARQINVECRGSGNPWPCCSGSGTGSCAGVCNGWQGWAYMSMASWPTNADQRIGPASEVEGGGGPVDSTPPAAPRNVRVL